jgi:hypothetical protein
MLQGLEFVSLLQVASKLASLKQLMQLFFRFANKPRKPLHNAIYIKPAQQIKLMKDRIV